MSRPPLSDAARDSAAPLNDAHVHFFSSFFFDALSRQRAEQPTRSAEDLCGMLGWIAPGSAEALADRWAEELNRHGVGRAALIASVPGDEESVSLAVARHPARFVGYFMLDPTAPDAAARADRALGELGLKTVCLFPAMQRYPLDDRRVREILEIASRRQAVVFVHCGALSVGVRKRLGLPSRFELRFGNPLDVHRLACEFPDLTFVIPHFGAGMLREALMAADLCANIYLDTSSSNKWVAYHPGLTLAAVFRQALQVAGPKRLLFGTDSSFFPRGWNAEVHRAQAAALDELGLDEAARHAVLAGNFDRLFPARR